MDNHAAPRELACCCVIAHRSARQVLRRMLEGQQARRAVPRATPLAWRTCPRMAQLPRWPGSHRRYSASCAAPTRQAQTAVAWVPPGGAWRRRRRRRRQASVAAGRESDCLLRCRGWGVCQPWASSFVRCQSHNVSVVLSGRGVSLDRVRFFMIVFEGARTQTHQLHSRVLYKPLTPTNTTDDP